MESRERDPGRGCPILDWLRFMGMEEGMLLGSELRGVCGRDAEWLLKGLRVSNEGKYVRF